MPTPPLSPRRVMHARGLTRACMRVCQQCFGAGGWARLGALLALLVALPAAAFDLQGHRGARGLAPENTLAAFSAALAVGVTTLELDVHVTRDGQVVVTHDPRLNPAFTRDAEGRWVDEPGPAVIELTLAQLQLCEVGRAKPGSRYAQLWPEQRGMDGERITTLAALFEAVDKRGATAVRFNIETSGV